MKRPLLVIILMILTAVGFSSCIYDYYPDEPAQGDETVIPPDRTLLLLDIRTLADGASTTPKEDVKSLRVIIINLGTPQLGDQAAVDSIVECNRYIDFPTITAQGVDYTFSWPSVVGPKAIYVIANEKSIADDFSTELDKYKENENPENLREWLTNYEFEPSYPVENNSIYLPYTYSNDNFNPKPGQVNNVDCWLVPVATKFEFRFNNFRKNQINVDGITFSYVNHSNYLLPHLAPEERIKEFGNQNLSWIDWLAKISKMSQQETGFTSNESFNNLYGWITDYALPKPEDFTTQIFVGSTDIPLNVTGATIENEGEDDETITPGVKTLGPVYIAESRNYRDPNINQDESETTDELTGDQTFYLTLKLTDTGGTTPPDFENLVVPNLKALFRNTHVIITINMTEGDIEVYAEIADWNKKYTNGWVSEGNAPSNNPFSLRKK